MPLATLADICVKDVMTTKPVAVSPSMSVHDLSELLDANEISGVPVVDVQERVIGVVSKTDLLHQWIRGSDESYSGSFIELLEDGLRTVEHEMDTQDAIEAFMSVEPITVRPEEPIATVAKLMVRERVHRVIVTDEHRRLLGIVTTLDILKHISE